MKAVKSRDRLPVAIVQARLGSTRFPRKVLEEVRPGLTVLDCVVQRLRLAERLHDVVVAVPEMDEELRQFVKDRGWTLSSGSEDDVLNRYYEAARQQGADPVVRVTSDCPLVDPSLVNTMVEQFEGSWQHVAGGMDYLSNNLEWTFPHGLDVEVFSFKALRRCNEDAGPEEREHVTTRMRTGVGYVARNFRFNMQCLNRIELAMVFASRLTVDFPEDLELVREIYKRFPAGSHPSYKGILKTLVEDPGLVKINQARHLERCAGLGLLGPVEAAKDV